MDGVRGGEAGLAPHLRAVDHLDNCRAAGVAADIDDVQVAGPEAGDDEVGAREVAVAGAAADLPAVVVQLVPDARHRGPVGDLPVGVRLRVHINHRQEVGFLDAGASVEGGDV